MGGPAGEARAQQVPGALAQAPGFVSVLPEVAQQQHAPAAGDGPAGMAGQLLPQCFDGLRLVLTSSTMNSSSGIRKFHEILKSADARRAASTMIKCSMIASLTLIPSVPA